jgi:hypothetical protein
MSVVRPEFGPTLPELLGPRVRALPRAARIALAALVVAAVVVVAWLLVRGEGGRSGVVVREPVAFNLVYSDALRRVAPRVGESLRLRSRSGAPQNLAVRPLRLAPYRGDVSAALTILASRLIDEMRASIPGFVARGEGRVNVNKQPGYQIVFQARIGGRTTYGKRVLLVAAPDPPPREGVDITMLAARSGAVPSVDAVAAGGALKTAYRSFRFGEDRPS